MILSKTLSFLILFAITITTSLSATSEDEDGDARVRIFRSSDGKTICESKLKDRLTGGQFSCELFTDSP
jgi:hypothetical protein